jgi:hypothetical protein
VHAMSQEGAWDEWLTLFLEGLRSHAEISYDRTHRLRGLQERYKTEYAGSTNTD